MQIAIELEVTAAVFMVGPLGSVRYVKNLPIVTVTLAET